MWRIPSAVRFVAVATGAILCSTCSLFDLFGLGGSTPHNRVLWHVPGHPVTGVPAFDGERVFFATNEHTVVALDAATGRQLWVAKTDSGAAQSVDLNLAGCTMASTIVACGDNGDLVGLDHTSGRFVWRFHPATGSEPGEAVVVAVDSTLYAGSREGGALYAVDARTGALRWMALEPLTDSTAVRSPAADADLVVGPYIRRGKPTTGGLLAVDARTGAVRWDTPLPRIIPDSDSSPGFVALGDGLVFASSNSGRIFAIDRNSGAILWNLPGVGVDVPSSHLPRPVIFDSRALVVSGTRLYASSGYGWFTGIDIPGARELWRVDPKLSDGWSGPIYSDGKSVYVMYFRGCVAVFSASTGKLRSIAGDDQLFVSIALGPDSFFAPGDDGFWAFAK